MNMQLRLNTRKTEELHQLFRGSAEAAKILGWTTLGFEVVAGLAATARAWSVERPAPGWTAFILFMLLLLTTGLRIFARRWRSYSEKCRRASAKAYAANEDPPAATHSDLVGDAPPYAAWFASGLPAPDLEAYYEPTKPPGVQRLRELYAQNSFYSWRLLRIQFYLLASLAALVLIAAITAFFRIAHFPLPMDANTKLADTVCTLALGLFFLKAAEAALASSSGSAAARQVADALVRPEAAQPDRTKELVDRYDIDRAAGPTVATLVYKLAGSRLQKEWEDRRDALDGT
jgi:hypothetical protein